jgi:hypothetical protein
MISGRKHFPFYLRKQELSILDELNLYSACISVKDCHEYLENSLAAYTITGGGAALVIINRLFRCYLGLVLRLQMFLLNNDCSYAVPFKL